MLNNAIAVGNTIISEYNRPYFIADIAANHDGCLDRAYRLIELAKEAGADCAKFQNFQAAKIVSRNGFDTLGSQLSHQASWKKSVFEVYEDASIPEDWSALLKAKCDEVGIEYMTSPYDYQSIDATDQYLNAYKIGSGDITWVKILEYIAKKDKPVFLATGASSLEDVQRAVDAILALNTKLVIMQCNTNYTASCKNYNHINLNVLTKYRQLFPNCLLGLSDHTLGHATVLGAIALGARVIEKHFTDDNNRMGPDHKFSMNSNTWRDMVDRASELYVSLGDGIKRIEDNEKETAIVQRRCLYYQKDLTKGQIITEDDVFPLRPFKQNGIQPYEQDEILGRVLQVDVKKDEHVKWSDINA
ncbi:N-acetylneuraminate synthase [Desulfuribacillus stibiiarsenatis]|uniref:N-acetylneuraminate synthase n=1 Tax=Desulfuribacillus stibiiarsenatis TaxID=1390249 RepID=A0A1E5L5U8_9FIRM|nr:N-acetylneuraminate synthase family protein [Desulfuribacillus stibiiarsenatis]OEH85486.1 N-acetylneuraminate synthase [Desulfuribacillus stibiiarsenatis]